MHSEAALGGARGGHERSGAMLAWDALGGLDAYRITEIPRRPEPGPAPAQADSDDPGRIQRLAALVAAYHVGAEAKGNGSGAGAIGGISDGLLPGDERRPDGRPAPSLEECLLAAWPGPFGWLLIAEPLSAAEIFKLAEELAQ